MNIFFVDFFDFDYFKKEEDVFVLSIVWLGVLLLLFDVYFIWVRIER